MDSKDAKLFYVYRPNTGQQVKQVSPSFSIITMYNRWQWFSPLDGIRQQKDAK